MNFNSNDNKKIIEYRPDIDGLRALAILLVVLYHAFPDTIKGGFIGVDIFFVISGYLISGIILKSLLNNNFSYIDFYKRRIRRIFPALIVILFACLFLGWLILFSQEYKILGKHIVGGAIFISNIFYWKESGYFDISSNLKPLLHLWSLGVEEQFYIFWPIVLVLLYRKTSNIIRFTLLFLIFSLLLNILIGQNKPEAAFYFPITRLWELMTGAILAQITLFYGDFIETMSQKLKIPITKKVKSIVQIIFSSIGLLFLILSLLIINEKNFYQGWVILAIVGIFFLIASGPKNWINKKILSNRIMVYIGLISYPLYLWHWPLLSFANIITSESTTIKLRLVIIIISFILAWLTYKLVEYPIRFGKIKYINITLCVALLMVGFAGSIIYLNNGFKFRFPVQENLIDSISIKTKELDYNIKLCKKLYPQKTTRNHFCYISGHGPKKIFIIGDSHTRAIYTGYAKSLTDLGYTVINRGISGCPGMYMSGTREACNSDIKKVIDSIIQEKPAGIIISNNYNWVRPHLFEKGMDETISNFPKNIPIVWILQTPRIDYNLMNCVERTFGTKENSENCYISRHESEKKIIEHNNIIKNLKEKYSNLITIDPHDVLCGSTNCPITLNNQFLYEDNNFHLSIFGSYYLSEKMPIHQFFKNVSSN